MSVPIPAPRILVADDDMAIREILCEILEGHGAKVTVVEDGAATVHQAMLEPFDLCVLDYEMPNKTGVEACALIRQSAVNRAVPILFMTGRTDEQSINSAFEAGASDYLFKPVHPVLLWMRAKNLLALAKIEKQSEDLSGAWKAAGKDPKV